MKELEIGHYFNQALKPFNHTNRIAQPDLQNIANVWLADLCNNVNSAINLRY